MATNGVSSNATSPKNPTYLPARYEIRRLGPEHADWAKAIVMHSNIFLSPVWPAAYPKDKTARLHRGMKAGTYLINHQIESGMSFGVFDTEYKYKRPESEATQGRLYWDESEDIGADELLDQMDFPLVSVALAYDQINPLDFTEIMRLIEVLPLFGTVYHVLEELDPRDPASWKATEPKQVLMRNATSTRHDYEGAGIMKKLAQFLMRQAKLEGYRGIQIECLHDAVIHTWANPPEPFRGEIVSKFATGEYEEKDGEGNVTYPFRPSEQLAAKIYVHL